MSFDNAIGSVHTTPIATLAARCADRIMDCAGLRAVTLDPDGRVWVENPDHAAECDMVGVFHRSLGHLTLARAIRDDLQHEKSIRRLVARKRRNVLSEREIQRRRVGIA